MSYSCVTRVRFLQFIMLIKWSSLQLERFMGLSKQLMVASFFVSFAAGFQYLVQFAIIFVQFRLFFVQKFKFLIELFV